MNQDLNKIWLVVVTYNAEKWIQNLGNSIKNSTVKVTTVIVDNNSSDNTIQLIESFFPDFKVITNKKNEGFGKANNLGLKMALQAEAEYVFLLNQDAKLLPNTLSHLLNVAESMDKDEYGIYSPIHLDYAGENIDPIFTNYISSNSCSFFSDILFGRKADIYSVQFMPAAAWLLNCSVVRKVGGFDTLFFMYGEDYDLCIRMIRYGYKVGLVPSSFACHHRRGKPPQHVSLKKKIWDLYWPIIIKLKDPKKSFFYSLILTFLRNSVTLLKSIVFMKIGDIYCLLRVWITVLTNLKLIWLNRVICQSEQGAFLNDL